MTQICVPLEMHVGVMACVRVFITNVMMAIRALQGYVMPVLERVRCGAMLRLSCGALYPSHFRIPHSRSQSTLLRLMLTVHIPMVTQ
jgi:hypothetical protein